jgi:hypothetical protein
VTEDEKIKAENEKKRKELIQSYKRLFMTDDGKKVLEDLASFCGYNKSSVCAETYNPWQTMFAEGKRRAFLRIDNFLRRKEDE